MSIRKLLASVSTGVILAGSLGFGSTVEAFNQNQENTEYHNQEIMPLLEVQQL